MRITCLVDNCALDGFGSEHGLSFWVEACGKKLLFDSGESGLFLENAARLGIDVAEADFAVVSHGHYDHGGGLTAFFAANPDAKAYVRAGAFAPRYARRRSGNTEYIGLDASLAGSGRVVETGETCALAPGLTLFSGVRGRELFSGANRLLLGPDGETPDDFAHEQHLLIREGERRVLIAGCSHCGIVNILSRLSELEPEPPDAVIGGFHLAVPGTGDVDEALVDGVAERLLALSGTMYYTGHCTGLPSYERLAARMGPRVAYLHAGETVEI